MWFKCWSCFPSELHFVNTTIQAISLIRESSKGSRSTWMPPFTSWWYACATCAVLPLLFDSELQKSIMIVCICQQTAIQLLQHFIFCLQWSPMPCQLSFNFSEEIVPSYLFFLIFKLFILSSILSSCFHVFPVYGRF